MKKNKIIKIICLIFFLFLLISFFVFVKDQKKYMHMNDLMEVLEDKNIQEISLWAWHSGDGMNVKLEK